jgi:plastocyanin
MSRAILVRLTVGLSLILGLAAACGSAAPPASGPYQPGPAPGAAGFVAGTPVAPRVVRILAGPGYQFTPSDVPVMAGETITFVVSTMGPAVHEFKVGNLADVVADDEAAPEIADIGMMQTKELTYTFDGPGPFGFACHEPGHFEAGMRGTITVIG